ncbi:hypothetical protein AB0C93_24395 [Streptomyces sp. NPDC048518]|uniref:hypothetical protein n=1 Tax=Streptomyces sp. NPDC048518 TaxID=3155029 RepID=UPI003408D74F
MVRNVLGSVLALVGATAAVWSPFRAWYDGRHGRDFRIGDLFSGGGVTDAGAELFGSLFLPFAVAALLTLAGLLLRSRLLVAVAGVLVLGFTVLWMVRQGQAEGSLSVAGDGSGLGQGVLGAFGGGVLLLLGAAVMSGRGGGRGRRGRRVSRAPYGEDTAPGPYADDPAQAPYAGTPDRAPYADDPTQAPHAGAPGRAPYDDDSTRTMYVDDSAGAPYGDDPAQAPYPDDGARTPPGDEARPIQYPYPEPYEDPYTDPYAEPPERSRQEQEPGPAPDHPRTAGPRHPEEPPAPTPPPWQPPPRR